MKKLNTQKGNAIWIVLVVIVLIVIAVWWFMMKGYHLPGQTAQAPTTGQIQDTAGLDAAAEQLDSTNLNQMDNGINQISADSSSF